MNYFFPPVVSFSNNSLLSVWLPWKLLISRRRRKNWFLAVFVGCYYWLLLTLVVETVPCTWWLRRSWLFLVAVGCICCFEVLKTYVTEEKLVVGCCWSLLVVLKLLVLWWQSRSWLLVFFCCSYCWLLLLVVACCWLCSEVPCTWVAEEKLVVGCWLLLVVLKFFVPRWPRRSWWRWWQPPRSSTTAASLHNQHNS